jgi:hypothetical protein
VRRNTTRLTHALRLLAEPSAASGARGDGDVLESPHPDFETLLAYAADELDPAEEALIRDHLRTCRTCPRLLLELDAYYRRADHRRQPDQTARSEARGAAVPVPVTRATAATGARPRNLPPRWAGARAAASGVTAMLLALLSFTALLVAASVSATALRDSGRAMQTPARIEVIKIPRVRSLDTQNVTVFGERAVLTFDDLQARMPAVYDVAIYRPGSDPNKREHLVWSGSIAAPPDAQPLSLELPSAFLPAGLYRLTVITRLAGEEQQSDQFRLAIRHAS